jgi:hypothetical protein
VDKRSLTKLFLEQAGLEASDQSIKSYMPIWWVTPYSPIGFRLTSHGSGFLSQTLKLQKYTYQIKKDFQKNLKVMLQMNKHLAGPFYMPYDQNGNTTITVYGEQDAFMMSMMGGDLQQYLDNFTRE